MCSGSFTETVDGQSFSQAEQEYGVFSAHRLRSQRKVMESPSEALHDVPCCRDQSFHQLCQAESLKAGKH